MHETMTDTDRLLTIDDAELDHMPLERLEAEIAGFASRLAAATAHWLLWIAAYDRREGWTTWQAKSCAHWLNWQCGVSPRTAREHVATAHKLDEFRQLRNAFLAGQLSYSKVRAICRVIEPVNETDHESKTGVITRLGGMHAMHADTATSLITGTIDATNGTQATVLVVAGIDALTNTDPTAESTVDSQRVDPTVVQRLCCDGIIQTALVDQHGTELAVSSEQRIVPRRLRRLLEGRDHAMCQFPGCESEHRLHAHHVTHWVNGGKTELVNLVSLCHFHHHSVHEGGWNITATTNGWTFHDPHGTHHHVPVLQLPTSTPLPHTKNGAAAPLAGTGERCNTGLIADILTSNTHLRNQRA
jgi:hypothetical protein